MRRWLSLVFVVLAVAAGGAFWLYRSTQYVPEFYAAALTMPPEAADRAGDEFSSNAMTLAGEVRKEGTWSALFSQDQINGWLTVDLLEKHPELLPQECAHPRVRLLDDRAQVGMKMTLGGVETIVWLDLEAHMTPEHEIAVRLADVRAGDVPLPAGEVLDAVTQAAKNLDLSLRWTTVDGAPTAIIGLPPLDADGLTYELRRLKLSEGGLYVSGTTLRDKKS